MLMWIIETHTFIIVESDNIYEIGKIIKECKIL